MELMEAIAFHIRKQYPDAKLSEIAKALGITIPEISRMLNLRYLPTLNRIFDLENQLGVDIIKVNFTDQTNHLQKINERLKRIEKALDLPPEMIISDDEDFSQPTNKSHLQYDQIICDPFYSKNFDTLLAKLNQAFEPIVLKNNKDFTLRSKERYISISLVKKMMKTGGNHIMMIRYTRPKQILNIEFITSRYERFKEFVMRFSDYSLEEKPMGIFGIPLKLKESAKVFHLYHRKDGHSSLIYSRPMNDEDIELIVKLALWVYDDYNK